MNTPMGKFNFSINFVFGFILVIISIFAIAKPLPNISEIGDHQKILIFEKNEHPNNIMVLYTKLNHQCQFLSDPKSEGRPFIDFYWLMDRKDYKPVNIIIKSEVRRRLKIQSFDTDSRNSFSVALKDLNKFGITIADPIITVKSSSHQEGCHIEALFNIQEANNKRVMRLNSIKTESVVTWKWPFRKIESITLNGTDVQSGKQVFHEFRNKSFSLH